MEKAKKDLNGIRKYFAQGSLDVTFLMLVLSLLAIGLVMLYSAGYSYAYYKYSDGAYFIKNQLLFAAIGLVLMLGLSKLKFEYFKYFAVVGVGISLFLLLLVLVLPEWKPGFKRWIEIPGITTFQPSEVAKLGLILFMAWAMDKYKKLIREQWWSFIPFITIVVVFSGLVFLENHLSGTILMLALGTVMMWLGGFNWKWFAAGGAVVLVVALVMSFGSVEFLKDYMGERIVAWRNKDFEPRGARWQINQSLYAIGSGGFLGQGLGESKQKHLYVSEPQNDFIFSIVLEELGFIGGVLIILLFAALVWRGFVIASKAQTRFGCLLAMGLVFQIGLQVALNIAVVTDTVPNTGISLPFFSAGGTSLVMLMAQMGMVLSVSRYSNVEKV